MKTNFMFWVASVSLAPTLGFAFAETFHSAHAESPAVHHQACEPEAREWALQDFSFYSNGTRSDGSPAIACDSVEVVSQQPANDGAENLQFQLQCYTLDRAIQRKYDVSAQHLASGECQKQALNSEDNSP